MTSAALCLAPACSNSDDGAPATTTPETGAGANLPSGTGGSSPATPGSAPNGSGTVDTGTNTDGNVPGDLPLSDPNRDPSVPLNLIASGAVACGAAGSFCVAPNLTCCSTPAAAGGGNDFSCAADASGCPTGTVSTLACSNQASCTAGDVCCRSGNAGGGGQGGPGGNNVSTTCEAACAAGTVQVCLTDVECGDGNDCNNGVCAPAACTATSCGAGELCCRGQGNGAGAAAACVAVTDGLCPMGRRQLCNDATECPDGNTCAPQLGGGGGGVTLCTAPPCTPTSCATGQICCVGGNVGGNPTCSAVAATGACPGNARLVCTDDTECVTAAGATGTATACLPGNGGGGGGVLSCRVPPPPAVADAGVDGG